MFGIALLKLLLGLAVVFSGLVHINVKGFSASAPAMLKLPHPFSRHICSK
jgi:hypothetical protein